MKSDAREKTHYPENTSDFRVGELVSPIYETYALREKCLWPENFDKTILPWDNVLLKEDSVGMVVGFINWHTCMVVVCWGGTYRGQKLVIAVEKLIKATPKVEKTP